MKNYVRTISQSYPGFFGLPRGIKRMLVVSELFFWEQDTKSYVELDSRPRFNTSSLNNSKPSLPFSSRDWLN
ncbi:MAG TPA: hypothetical protein VKY92_13795 [Verrucomicrobiae bacterium]|nr:hypothetical protein [Verrucomicrobiae bacterium]